MPIEILRADLDNPTHATAIVAVLDSYASDPIGGGTPLSADVQTRLIPALREHPTTIVLLAMDDSRAVGVAICFLGFSTFQARPLLNVHDLAVVPERRGQGIGSRLLGAVESTAIERKCCKLTLEVLEDNRRARRTYERFGFREYGLGDSAGTRFLTKSLPGS